MESHGLGDDGRTRVAVRPAAATAARRADALEDATRPRGQAPTLSEVIAAMAERRGAAEEPGPGTEVERVACPGCGTEYGLPPGIVPPWGGCVRCPRCAAVFSVGVRAEADELVARVAAIDAARWRRACADHSLWGTWGEQLLEAYAVLRSRHGSQLAARGFRRALEDAAPGVPWLAPPTPPSPLEPEAAGVGSGTMFERRQGT